jgi:hypothetical protein
METLPPTLGINELALQLDVLAAERFETGVLGWDTLERWPEPRPVLWSRPGSGVFLGLWSRDAGGEWPIVWGCGGAHTHVALRVPHGSLKSHADRVIAAGLTHERIPSNPATSPCTSTILTGTSSN